MAEAEALIRERLDGLGEKALNAKALSAKDIDAVDVPLCTQPGLIRYRSAPAIRRG